LRNRYDLLRGILGRSIAPRLARRCDHVVAVSEFTRGDLLAFMKLPSDKVTVIPGGFNPGAFYRRPAPAVAEFLAVRAQANPYFLYVARLEHPAKNHLRLLEAYEQFRAKSGSAETAELVLAGSDWHGASTIHSRIASSPFSSSIRRLGFVPADELPSWYCGAIAAVLPSLSEGFGLPLLESQACGIPVAAADRDSLPEVAGPAAILFDPESVSSIAGALARLRHLSAEERRCRLDAGRDWTELFSWESCANRLVELYSAVHARRAL
jgi:glycosyltransferase involved in cell wall biosynthesis